MQPMEPTSILLNGASPGDWQPKEQRIEPCVIEALTDVPSSREQHSRGIVGNGSEPFYNSLPLSGAHPASQYDEVWDIRFEASLHGFQMLGPLRQHQR